MATSMQRALAQAMKRRNPAGAVEDMDMESEAATLMMMDEDRQEGPATRYNGDGLAEAVNRVTKTGEALRRNKTLSSEQQAAADKEAYMKMMKKRMGK